MSSQRKPSPITTLCLKILTKRELSPINYVTNYPWLDVKGIFCIEPCVEKNYGMLVGAQRVLFLYKLVLKICELRSTTYLLVGCF